MCGCFFSLLKQSQQPCLGLYQRVLLVLWCVSEVFKGLPIKSENLMQTWMLLKWFRNPFKVHEVFSKVQKERHFRHWGRMPAILCFKKSCKILRMNKNTTTISFPRQRPLFFYFGFQAADPNPNIVIPPKTDLFPYIARLCLKYWWTDVA